MSKFQIILTGIFIVFIIIGVVMFATYKNNDDSTGLPPITVWGTISSELVSGIVTELNNTRTSPLVIQYYEMDQANFDREFIEALARRQGPDAILIPQDMLLRHEDKLLPIPATILTERDFKNTYIPLAELYLNVNREILALPFAVDPLVMYWNRDIFTNAGIATYPKSWEDIPAAISKINMKDANANIRRTTVAMGEFTNINHAREILGALLLQAGNPVTARGDASTGGRLVSTLGDGQFSGSKFSAPAVTFFTQFANTRDPYYSWNRSLPISKSFFLSGGLATYFGFASELFDIRSKNPNLNFDVAPLPQVKGTQNRVTYGKMYGFSIVNTTTNPSNTYAVLSALTAPEGLAVLNRTSALPPVRRDMIAAGSKDPYQAIFFDSALISRSWLDSNSARTSQILQALVESVTSGRANVYNAIQTAHQELDLSLLNK